MKLALVLALAALPAYGCYGAWVLLRPMACCCWRCAR
jgi:hypothetical protein